MCDCNIRPDQVTRRQAVGALAATALLGRGALVPEKAPGYGEVADGVQRWLARHALPTADGVTWAADPSDPKSIQSNLYSGAPGVVLFLAEHARVPRNPASLDLAVRGARDLAARVARARTERQRGATSEFDGEGMGLYTGAAGLAYLFERMHRLTDEPGFRTAASSVVALCAEAIAPDGAGGAWNGSTDIISGSSGIGLTLLWASHALGDERALSLAKRAGQSVLALGTLMQGEAHLEDLGRDPSPVPELLAWRGGRRIFPGHAPRRDARRGLPGWCPQGRDLLAGGGHSHARWRSHGLSQRRERAAVLPELVPRALGDGAPLPSPRRGDERTCIHLVRRPAERCHARDEGPRALARVLEQHLAVLWQLWGCGAFRRHA